MARTTGAAPRPTASRTRDTGAGAADAEDKHPMRGQLRGGHILLLSLRATHSCASVPNAPTQIFKTKKQKQVFRSKPTVTEGRGEEPAEEDPDGCGPECRNLLHESDHRKEDAKCPYDGMVIDIYGYCR